MDRLAVDVISPSFSRLKRKINADEENLQKWYGCSILSRNQPN